MLVDRPFTAEKLEQTLLQSTRCAPPTAEVPRERPTWTLTGAGSRVALPPPLQIISSLDAALRRRIAARHFAPGGIALDRLGTVLAASELRPAGADSSIGGTVHVSLYVHAWRTPEIPRAYYIYRPEEHCLDQVGPAPIASDIPAMFRQVEFADAAAILVIAGDLDDALFRYGDHGYCLLLLAGGAGLHRCWLSATQVGLAGCLCEAPFRWANGRLQSPLPCGQIPLLALALGEEPMAQAED